MTIHGTEYRSGCWLFIEVVQDETCPLPIFGLLHKILVIEYENQPPQVMFIVQKAKTYGFSRKVFGYIISEDKTNIEYKSIGCLIFYHPFNAIQTSMGLVVKSKYDLHAFCEK